MNDPQVGEFWLTSKERAVEIIARDEVAGDAVEGYWQEIDTIAYRFLGGTQVHLRAVSSIKAWRKAEFE